MGVENPKGLAEGDAGLDPGYEFISLPNEDNCCVSPKSPPSSTHRITHITSTKKINKTKDYHHNHTKLKSNSAHYYFVDIYNKTKE